MGGLMRLASVVVRLAGLSSLGACSRDVPLVVVHGSKACCWHVQSSPCPPRALGLMFSWSV